MYHVAGEPVSESDLQERQKATFDGVTSGIDVDGVSAQRVGAAVPVTIKGHERKSFAVGGNVSQERWDEIFNN